MDDERASDELRRYADALEHNQLRAKVDHALARSTEAAERAQRLAERVRLERLRCVECGLAWAAFPDERFRALLTAEDPGTSIALYCSSCAAYEFD